MSTLKQFWQRHEQTLTLILVSIIWLSIGWVLRSRLQSTEVALFNQARQAIVDIYPFAAPDSQALAETAVRAMLDSIDDPHAGYLAPPVAERFAADFEGQTGVTGMLVELVDGVWQVTVILPEGAAAASGLQVGDVVKAIDGVVLTSEMTPIEITLLLRGPIGQQATFDVERAGQSLTLTPVRAPRLAVSEPQMLAGDIGYLAQYTFTSNAPAEVEAALTTLLAQDPRAIVYDLRSNGGGSMTAAVEVMSDFLDDGLVVYQAELKDGVRREFRSEEGGVATAVPLVVLVGDRTYSSAETVAISLQEHGRARLFGSVTHGKGTIQDVLPLPGGGAMQMTVAKWLSPSGVWVDGVGVTPDVAVVDDPDTVEDEVLQAALAYLNETVRP